MVFFGFFASKYAIRGEGEPELGFSMGGGETPQFSKIFGHVAFGATKAPLFGPFSANIGGGAKVDFAPSLEHDWEGGSPLSSSSGKGYVQCDPAILSFKTKRKPLNFFSRKSSNMVIKWL